MKRLFCITLALLMAVSMAVLIPPQASHAAGKTKAKQISYKTVPSMNSIRVSWKKAKASYYLVYRVEHKTDTENNLDVVPFSKYRKIAKVSGKKASYTDKKVKKGKLYSYAVRGYKKTKKGPQLVCNSYRNDVIDYDCAGLQGPVLFNGGYGEFYTNSKDKLYLQVHRTLGVKPGGAVIYRRAAGESKYKKISVKKISGGSINMEMIYRDSSVKPGTTYYYRAKTYVKKNGKRYYSKSSDTLRIPAVNFTGTYGVQAMTSEGQTDTFTICMDSKQYNGALTLKPAPDTAFYRAKAGGTNYPDQEITLTEYSRDGENWSQVPTSGVKIKAEQTVWLKFRFTAYDGAYFAGSDAEQSIISMEENMAVYDGPGRGWTVMTIDFAEGTAKATVYFD